MNQKGLAPVLIIILLSLILGALAVGFYVGKLSVPKTTTNSAVTTQNFTPISTNKEYQISGSEVVKIFNEEKTVLFKNVENVSEVRLGPDGATLHFKPTNKTSFLKESQEYCANLERIDKPADALYPNPPPNQPPWDFKRISHAYTIGGCGFRANGYLTNSDYFVYLEIKNRKEGIIFFEDLKTGGKKSVKIDSNLLNGFYDGGQKANSYWEEPISGHNGYDYVYPRQDVKSGNKLVLAFARLIIAVDKNNNQFIGGKGFGYNDGSAIIATSFYFLNEKSLPYVVIESGYEGPSIFAYLLDVSGDNLKIIKLADLDKRSWLDFKIEPLVWNDDSLIFNFLDFEDITDQLSKDYLKDIASLDESQIVSLSKNAEELLKKSGRYEDIKCDLHMGLATPSCQGLKRVNQYKYTSKNGLVKL